MEPFYGTTARFPAERARTDPGCPGNRRGLRYRTAVLSGQSRSLLSVQVSGRELGHAKAGGRLRCVDHNLGWCEDSWLVGTAPAGRYLDTGCRAPENTGGNATGWGAR